MKPENDPWTHLLVQLSGVSKKKPKALQAHQWWSKDHFDTIVRADFYQRCADQGIKGKALVNFHEKITREHFLATDEEMQSHYTQLAKDEATATMEEWTKTFNMSPATDPVSRQV